MKQVPKKKNKAVLTGKTAKQPSNDGLVTSDWMSRKGHRPFGWSFVEPDQIRGQKQTNFIPHLIAIFECGADLNPVQPMVGKVEGTSGEQQKTNTARSTRIQLRYERHGIVKKLLVKEKGKWVKCVRGIWNWDHYNNQRCLGSEINCAMMK